jgi:hypothetical protein
LAKNDPNPAVRIAATHSITCIRTALSGKVPAD